VLDKKKIKGIIDSHKIFRYTYTEGFRPNQTPVGEIANSGIVLARPNTSLEDALALMIELKQETLPVVNSKPVGTINIYELLKFQLKTKPKIAHSIA
jgi:CBS domain-containing protein